jgi:hypothetical protein
MAQLKTTENEASVDDFLQSVPDEERRADSRALLQMMQDISGCAPKMWGTSIIGFDSYHYKYESGHEGEAALIGFSPRKQHLVLYIHSGYEGHEALMEKLGKYKTGKSCLYIKRLKDVDMDVLRQLITAGLQEMKRLWKS